MSTSPAAAPPPRPARKTFADHTSGYILSEKVMRENWEPISKSELLSKIATSQVQMSPSQLRLWEAVKIPPAKWQQNPWGNLGNGFWVVAIIGERVVWYNDIEEGFNRSWFENWGQIPDDEYWCDQNELEWTLQNLLNELESDETSIRGIGHTRSPPNQLPQVKTDTRRTKRHGSMNLDETWHDVTAQMQDMMVQGTATWRGPGYRPHLVASLLGCAGPEEFSMLCGNLESKLRSRCDLSPTEWTQALLLTEVAFGSRVAGQGSQWHAMTGVPDGEALVVLRSLQRVLSKVVASVDTLPFQGDERWRKG